jgi:hypothetical protein
MMVVRTMVLTVMAIAVGICNGDVENVVNVGYGNAGSSFGV